MSSIISHEERPWGNYEVLSSFTQDTVDVVIKKIVVNPGKRLSLQSHRGRDESWLFIAGHGEVTIGDEEKTVQKGSVVSAPKGTKHRIANTDPIEPLVLIETSVGVFDEQDITRYEDDFGRI